MTVSVQTPYTNHVGNGVTATFPYTFRVLDAVDLVVMVNGSTKVLGTDYTVTGLGVETGGNVVFSVVPASLAPISLVRRVARKRDTDYQYSGDFQSDTVNKDLDRIVMMQQDNDIALQNAVRLPAGDAASGLLPDAAGRALKFFGFDASGNIVLAPMSVGDATALALLLASYLLPTQGAGAVGYSPSVTYGPNTVGDKLKQLGLANSPALVVNGNFAINQRAYVSGTPTTSPGQVTLDRWNVVVAGQSVTFGAASPDRLITVPAGGIEQVIQAAGPVANVEGGVHAMDWDGTATATVNGLPFAKGGNTGSLSANTPITIRFFSGTLGKVRFNAGTVAQPFEHRGDMELFYCQADYQKSYAIGTPPGSVTTTGAFLAAGNAAATITAAIRLGRPMRIAPIISLWDTNGNASSVLSLNSAGTPQTRSAGASSQTTQGFNINSDTLGTDVLITGHWAAATGL
ncbi:hypothetical protein J2W34_000043 [Variovorax boronicumulans]|uniref:hypothetical protein n=1 Tax=Variovorax boronicumulans TaxID=436515 RepID=UPI00277E1DC6|nr:hypothetical protein [Variovorax boronicumulans]MDQ0068269.1 hypothetical protein [Variovorax boronicumulans]